ncbi:MAG: 50S ribosomal protein L13, partial [Endomicrobia bacterium]|nr:50S ribosomal protein L13 [Endomicrobiia bacterium]
LASEIAKILIGKHKPIYSPDRDCGDFVVVKNASKLVFTGKKLQQKILFRHSGYLGGDKYIPYEKLFPQKADFLLREAVKGMLPKNKLRAKMIKRLKIFNDDKINLPTSQKFIEIK